MATNEHYACMTLTNGDGVADPWELDDEHYPLSSNLVL